MTNLWENNQEAKSGRGSGFIWPLKETVHQHSMTAFGFFYIDSSYAQPLAIPVWINLLAFRPKHPKWDQNLQFTPLIKTTSIPDPFMWESTLRGVI